jgi:phosphohistidine swiveling domain-containing protein
VAGSTEQSRPSRRARLNQAAVSTRSVIDLEQVSSADVPLVGGKAAALGEMLRTGLPVPKGFCVTTEAYRECMGGLRPVPPDAKFPDTVVEAITRAYESLVVTSVAVRSSATAEDLPQASFAGQQDSFLNVRGRDAVIDAVRRCWASLWSPRAVQYREHLGVDPRDVAMGVVVQTLVPADVAGVLFTANPSTGARDEIVVNASFGLGEAVVSGLVTPDIYVLDKSTLVVKQTLCSPKPVMVVPGRGGGTRQVSTPEDQVEGRTLSDVLLRQLATLGLRAETCFAGMPQDVEWAVSGDRCWLVQSRPITRLPPPPLRDVRWNPPMPESVWIRRQVAENLPEPLSPLFEELYLRDGLERSLDALTAFLRMPYFHMEAIGGRPFFTTVNGYAYQRASFSPSWSAVPMLARATFDGWRIMWGEGVVHWRDQALPSYLAVVERWKSLDPARLPDQQLLRGIRELTLADATYWFAAAVVVWNAKFLDDLLNRFLALAAPRQRLTSGLFLRGFASKTLEAQAHLEGLAQRIRSSGELRRLVEAIPIDYLRKALAQSSSGRAMLVDLEWYFDRYGHQIYNLDFVAPTQVDDPLPVLLSLRTMALQPASDIVAHQAELARERDQLADTTIRTFGPIRRRLFHILLRWAKRFGPYREEALFHMGLGWPTLRPLALELGRRLVETGALHAPDDVYYLLSAEIADAIARPRPDLRTTAQTRRELREQRKRLHPPAAVPLDRGLTFGPFKLGRFETQQRAQPGGQRLRGFAVSPGQVRAPASLILSVADFQNMQPGTILVCPTTTPAWTPLFSQAAGLVTDVGGILAHGSIVAREYGIPAVMGTGTATQTIAHAQTITVDGDSGEVHLWTSDADASSRFDSRRVCG